MFRSVGVRVLGVSEMGWNLPEKVRNDWFFLMMALGVLLIGVTGCVPRASLEFSPTGDPIVERKIHEVGDLHLAVATFSDDRIVVRGTGDPRLVGWGTGTGTLDTRSDIKTFVTQSFVEEMNRLGIHARVASVPVTPFGAPKNRLIAYRKFLGEDETVLLGTLTEFQFQIDHPRFGVGSEFSLLDMQSARIRTQVAFDLKFVDLGTGDVLWKGSLSSEREKNIHYKQPGEDLKAASALLSDTLRHVIVEAARAYAGQPH